MYRITNEEKNRYKKKNVDENRFYTFEKTNKVNKREVL